MFPTNVACESEINTVRNVTYRRESGIYKDELLAVQAVSGFGPHDQLGLLDLGLAQLPDRHWSNCTGSLIRLPTRTLRKPGVDQAAWAHRES